LAVVAARHSQIAMFRRHRTTKADIGLLLITRTTTTTVNSKEEEKEGPKVKAKETEIDSTTETIR
jgi:hypothetical protein